MREKIMCYNRRFEMIHPIIHLNKPNIKAINAKPSHTESRIRPVKRDSPTYMRRQHCHSVSTLADPDSLHPPESSTMLLLPKSNIMPNRFGNINALLDRLLHLSPNTNIRTKKILYLCTLLLYTIFLVPEGYSVETHSC